MQVSQGMAKQVLIGTEPATMSWLKRVFADPDTQLTTMTKLILVSLA